MLKRASHSLAWADSIPNMTHTMCPCIHTLSYTTFRLRADELSIRLADSPSNVRYRTFTLELVSSFLDQIRMPKAGCRGWGISNP